MTKRKVLTLQDIQDNEDREDRKLRKRRAAGRKEIQLSFDDEDEDLLPILSTKVKQVEEKLKSSKQLYALSFINIAENAKSSEQSPSYQRGYDSQEDEPQILLDELEREDSIESINNVKTLCFQLIESYEKRDLHRLFDSVEQNCAFRLFLYAVAYGQYTYWTQNKLFIDVLKSLLPQSALRRQQNEQEGQLIGLSLLSDRKLDELRQRNDVPSNHIMKVSMNLQVPNRMQKYFN